MLKINKLILLGALIAISFLSANDNEDTQTTITLAQVNEVEGSITLDYQSIEDIYGFQFQVSGVQLKDEFECDLQSGGINTDNGLVLAIDFGGAYLPQGDGTLIKLFYEFVDTPTNVEISGIEISGPDGTVLIADQTEYLTLPATPQDCGNVFNGSRTIDEYNNCCLSEELAYWYPDNDGDGLVEYIDAKILCSSDTQAPGYTGSYPDFYLSQDCGTCIDSVSDNCPNDANPEQLNFDNDEFGDVCDATQFGEADIALTNDNNLVNTIDIEYSSQVDLYGIQFELSGESIVGITATSDYFTVSEFNGNFVGIDISGGFAPQGDGKLLSIEFETINRTGGCIENVTLASSAGPVAVEIPGNNCFALDCNGVALGDAYEDDCGVCDNDPSNDNADQDCAGVCFGSAYEAELCEDSDGDGYGNPGSGSLECIGGGEITDGCSLPDFTLSLGPDGEVFYNTSEAIGGFQFNVDGATVSAASGGDAGAAGFAVSPGGNTVLGFSFTGATLVLAVVYLLT